MAIPGTADVLRLAGTGYQALERRDGTGAAVVGLLADVESILRRVDALITGIEGTQRRAAAAVEQVELVEDVAAATVARAEVLVRQAGTAIDGADTLVKRVDPVLTRFLPLMDRLEPMLQRLVETTSATEVDAVVKLIDALPTIVDKLDADILPVLDTLSPWRPICGTCSTSRWS